MKDLYGKKEKHDHKFSNLLKGCILAIVMLAPFFAILSKIVYVSVNKNAKDSYTESQIIELKEIATNESLIQGEQYTIQYNENGQSGQGPKFFYTDITINWSNYFNNIVDEDVHGFAIVASVNLYLYDENGIYINYRPIWGTEITGFSFTYDRIQNENNFGLGKSKILHVTYLKNKLDNAFYFAIEQSKEEEILNWTKNTPIYNAINSMNTGLGLSNNHILTYLLTYWAIILAIYIVFDIIIFVFTKLTHYLQ